MHSGKNAIRFPITKAQANLGWPADLKGEEIRTKKGRWTLYAYYVIAWARANVRTEGGGATREIHSYLPALVSFAGDLSRARSFQLVLTLRLNLHILGYLRGDFSFRVNATLQLVQSE